MRLEFMIDIHRPVPEVFGVVGNLENDPKWQKAVTQATKVSAGPIAEGRAFAMSSGSWAGQRWPIWSFATTPRRGGSVLGCVSGPFEFTTEVSFEPIARGTRMVTLVAGQPKGLVKLAAITLSSHRRHEIEADLHNLKRMLEAGSL